METIQLPPESLIPYEKNAKKHPQKQLEKIAESIKLTGFDQPIVVDANHVIIKGHGRRQVAIAEGIETVPVVVVDVPAEVARAARIIDNKSAESDWDLDLLIEELQALGETDLPTGFDEDELNEMLDELDELMEDIEGSDYEDIEEFDYDSGEGRPGTTQQYLTFGNRKMILTDEELNLLEGKLSQYQEKFGSNFGFARWLCG